MLNIIISVAYLFFSITFILKGGYVPSYWNRIDIGIAFFSGLISVNLFSLLVILPVHKNKLLRRILGTLFVSVFLLLYIYKLDRKFSVDANLIFSNLSIAGHMESIEVILSIFSWKKIIIFFGFIFSFLVGDVLVEKKSKVMEWCNNLSLRLKSIVFSLIFFLFSLVLGFSDITFDEGTSLLRHTIKYFENSSENTGNNENIPINTFLVSTELPKRIEFTPYQKSPNIFILMVESFSGRFLEYKDSSENSFMKNFMDLTKQGLYIEKYYGNSVQTARGQYAALFSQIPSYTQKVFTNFTDVTLKSIPQILRENGYTTAFIKAYKNIEFDDSGTFLRKNGFDYTFSLYDFLSEKEKASTWGWGPEDRIFYRHIPDFMNFILSEETSKKPVFMVLHTVMNHMYFDQVPEEKRLVYKNPSNLMQNYTNSIKLVDEQLGDFVRILKENGYWKDSLIIITGDHGFPIGEHDVIHNENSFYEEVFRTPILIIGKDHVPHFDESQYQFSHLDLGPTILDLLDLHEIDNTFVGRSILREMPDTYPVYCIQPYNGGYLVSIREAIKYLYHRESGRAFFYDLDSDPLEKDLLPEKQLSEELENIFRTDIQLIINRQKALEQNRLYPGQGR